MNRSDFLKQLRNIFKRAGFTNYKEHFYSRLSFDEMIVFGLQFSSYGKYCYIEYGYVFESINKHMPYPKFNQLNLNCGRIMTEMGKAIIYENIDSIFMINLERTIMNLIENMTRLISLGKDELIQYYISGASNQSWYIVGRETADYFNLPLDTFNYHFIQDKK